MVLVFFERKEKRTITTELVVCNQAFTSPQTFLMLPTMLVKGASCWWRRFFPEELSPWSSILSKGQTSITTPRRRTKRPSGSILTGITANLASHCISLTMLWVGVFYYYSFTLHDHLSNIYHFVVSKTEKSVIEPHGMPISSNYQKNNHANELVVFQNPQAVPLFVVDIGL